MRLGLRSFLYLLIIIFILSLSVVSAFGIVSDSKARLEIIQVSSEMYPSAGEGFVLDENILEEDYRQCSLRASDLVKVFDAYTYGLKEIIIHARLDLRRGLASKDKIWIRCLKDLDEFENIFIHELGHIVDHNYLVKNFEESISEDFYDISRFDMSLDGFVSGYGSTNEKEDFAETFLFYVKFGSEFRSISQNNELLMSKYEFMRDKVFDGFEFGLSNALREDIVALYVSVESQPYDVSVLYKL